FEMTKTYTRKEGSRVIMMTQSEAIEHRINGYLDAGYDDKMDIYNHVVDDLKVPRPTVRRVARDLVIKLRKRVAILSPPPDPSKVPKPTCDLKHLRYGMEGRST